MINCLDLPYEGGDTEPDTLDSMEEIRKLFQVYISIKSIHKHLYKAISSNRSCYNQNSFCSLEESNYGHRHFFFL